MPSRDIDVLLGEMSTLMSQGRHREALQKGQTLLSLVPVHDQEKRGVVFYNLGVCCNELSLYPEAETQYREAAYCIPKDADLWYNRANNLHQWGLLARRLGESDESKELLLWAMKYAAEALILNPSDDTRNLSELIRRSM